MIDLIHKRCWRVANPSAKEFAKDGGWTARTGKPDCSTGCKWFAPLKEAEYDWGVCLCQNGPRSGMLTFEHMGCGKFRVQSGRVLTGVEFCPVSAANRPT